MTILWVLIGYSLAFAGNGGFIGNLDQLFLKGVGPADVAWWDPGSTVYDLLGDVRHHYPRPHIRRLCRENEIRRILYFSAAWLLIVYCPICHWVWANPDDYEGFFALDNEGALDFPEERWFILTPVLQPNGRLCSGQTPGASREDIAPTTYFFPFWMQGYSGLVGLDLMPAAPVPQMILPPMRSWSPMSPLL